MLAQYFKQALRMFKDTPLIGTISVLGTAIAIALVMVMIMLFQIKIAAYKPEINKTRTLFATSIISEPLPGTEGGSYNSAAPPHLIENYLYNMQTPEIVGAKGYTKAANLSVSTKRLLSEYQLMPTDVNFWKIFAFEFIEGRPYSREEYESGMAVTVISQEVADMLFFDQSAVGSTVYIDHKPYTITGVVKDVSKAAGMAYAQVWVPIKSNMAFQNTNANGTVGDLIVCLLLQDSGDEQAVRNEFDGIIKKYSDNSQTHTVTGHLSNYIQIAFNTYWTPGGLKQYIIKGMLLILFLLMLPAINLTGITMNNIRQRSSEIGLRKTFGATNSTLMWQILMENLVITVIGAVIGFLLSLAFIHIGKDFLLMPDTMLTPEMLLRPFSFFAAVFFCLLMNLLSAGFPAWRMARKSIIESLNANEH